MTDAGVSAVDLFAYATLLSGVLLGVVLGSVAADRVVARLGPDAPEPALERWTFAWVLGLALVSTLAAAGYLGVRFGRAPAAAGLALGAVLGHAVAGAVSSGFVPSDPLGLRAWPLLLWTGIVASVAWVVGTATVATWSWAEDRLTARGDRGAADRRPGGVAVPIVAGAALGIALADVVAGWLGWTAWGAWGLALKVLFAFPVTAAALAAYAGVQRVAGRRS